MIKRILMPFLFTLTAFYARASYNPYVDGAKADMRVKIVDDKGDPVKDATVSLVFLTGAQKVDIAKGLSDALGVFGASRNCIGEMRLWIRKDGYYDTEMPYNVFDCQTSAETLKSRQWTTHAVDLNVVLKRKRQQVVTAFHSVDFRPYPATNEIVKLDLETLEWCPPHGNGKHDDMHLVFDGWRNQQDWDDFHEHLKVSFPNQLDGFYRLKVDSTSAFRYAYEADASASYEKSLELRNVHTKDGITESVKLPSDTYLIFRVRSQTNELGKIIHANYGRIGEKFRQSIGLSIKSWFNRADNDTNLEDARTR